ncbi:MAG: glycerophosphodiester phosphodiesterase [Clostridia bacterium]|nr:glycerophosphodiester phosphodiesterase [Clostridia bacterium]NCC42295.1 glycerophosphodiester phosphodiesterase [Clostridia bacterium]
MRIFAHRGFSGKYPENTMLAFKKAYAEGCDGIELDVQLTKDDVIVIMHDETIDRTTRDGHGNIRDYTYAELCKFDCCGRFPGKYSFQKIPTLREYLEWVAKTELITNIELKNSVYYYEQLEEKVVEMVKEFHMEERIIFSSFNHVSVLKCKKMLPQVPAGLLMETRMDNMGGFAKENGVEAYHPDLSYLSKDLVKDCHNRGIKVNVWTVNKKKDMKQMDKWKVDGVFTNYPDKAKKLKKQGIIA